MEVQPKIELNPTVFLNIHAQFTKPLNRSCADLNNNRTTSVRILTRNSNYRTSMDLIRVIMPPSIVCMNNVHESIFV